MGLNGLDGGRLGLQEAEARIGVFLRAEAKTLCSESTGSFYSLRRPTACLSKLRQVYAGELAMGGSAEYSAVLCEYTWGVFIEPSWGGAGFQRCWINRQLNVPAFKCREHVE